MNYKQLTGKSIREGFELFHQSNPHIFAAFENRVFTFIFMGRKKVSAKEILNWVRWNQYAATTDQNFKINDAYQAYYSRLFVEKYPQYSTLFTFRKLRNEQPEPYMQVDESGNLIFLT